MPWIDQELPRKAFNAGADARLRGDPMTMNPHHGLFTDTLRREWDKGWEEANKNYGRLAKWPIRELPPVRGERRLA